MAALSPAISCQWPLKIWMHKVWRGPRNQMASMVIAAKNNRRPLTDYWKLLSTLVSGAYPVPDSGFCEIPPTQIHGFLDKLLWHFSSERPLCRRMDAGYWGLEFFSFVVLSGWSPLSPTSTLERMRGQLEKLRICHTTLWLYRRYPPRIRQTQHTQQFQQQQQKEQLQQSLPCLRGRMLNHHKNVANRNRTCFALMPPSVPPSGSTCTPLPLPVSDPFCSVLFWAELGWGWVGLGRSMTTGWVLDKIFLITWWGDSTVALGLKNLELS